MQRTQIARHVLRAQGAAVLAAALLLLVGASGPVWSQDGSGEPEPAKPAVKFRGRLPAYFSRVVSQKQRDAIYGIQAGYADQLAKLESQIRELESARDKEVRDVLTPEQKKQVDAMMAAAKARRAGNQPPALPAPEPPPQEPDNAET